MGTVNFGGAGTGIDWNLLIESQIQARTRQVITPLKDWKTQWENKISTFDEIAALLGDLQETVDVMDSPAKLRSYSASSNNETAVEATATSAATAGSHTVTVNQLAHSELENHSGLADGETIVNDSGASQDFTYTYNGQTTTVVVSDGATLEQLADMINYDPNNPGVTASLLDDGSGTNNAVHLVLRGENSGANYTVEVDPATTLAGDWGDLTVDAAAGSSSVTVDDANSFAQYQAVLVADGDSGPEYHIVDSVSSNTLNLQSTLAGDYNQAQGAYVTARGTGSSFSLAASAGDSSIVVADASQFRVGQDVMLADSAGSEQVSVSGIDLSTNTVTLSTVLANSYTSGAYATQLEGGRKFSFAPGEFTEVQAATDAQVRVDGYPSSGWIERSTNTVTDVIPGVNLSLLSETGASPATVSVTEDPTALKEKIYEFVDAYNAVKRYMNEVTDYDESTREAGILLGNYVAGLVESQLQNSVTTPASGFKDGTDPFTQLAQIGINSNAGVDDKTSLGTLTVNEQALDQALSQDYESVVSLFSSRHVGSSDSSYLSFYTASESLTEPGTYEVKAVFDGSGNLTGAYMRAQGESTWNEAGVDSPYIHGLSGNPEYSLWVRAEWDGVSTEQTATVRVKQGVARRLSEVVGDILDQSEGAIHNVERSYQDIIGSIDKRIAVEEDRLVSLQQRLQAKYARLEKLMVQLQGEQQWSAGLAGTMSN